MPDNRQVRIKRQYLASSTTEEYFALGPFRGAATLTKWGAFMWASGTARIALGAGLSRTPHANQDAMRASTSLIDAHTTYGEADQPLIAGVGGTMTTSFDFPAAVKLPSGPNWLLFSTKPSAAAIRDVTVYAEVTSDEPQPAPPPPELHD